jgi:hypothetical protein
MFVLVKTLRQYANGEGRTIVGHQETMGYVLDLGRSGLFGVDRDGWSGRKPKAACKEGWSIR